MYEVGSVRVAELLLELCGLCVTVNVNPATVIVPVLELVDVFDDTEYITVPLPIPLLPLVMVIQLALLWAVQLQVLDEAVTVILPVVALAPTLAPVGLMLYVQALNVAVTLFAPSIVTVHVVFVPEHAPLQPANTDPLAGVAVSVTLVPELNDAEQVLPQFIPDGLLVTVPLPVPVFVTESVIGWSVRS